MFFSKPLLIALDAAVTSATHVHNEFGHNAWLQDSTGTEVQLNNGQSVSVCGGWAFVWVDAALCPGNPNSVQCLLRGDGRLYEASGGQISNGVHLC
ncbi:hypothetical protein ASPCAL13726 [Aspergillus calidoustus]|uniref:Cyanovirin-N domain-containing protein n=1 Tax=Aspergillus calidoustus TaxID=454130 RepID=A0A0U5GDY1_ASPCI|nr:hypothetical protein ASPCAL13726 [Aspergillus calidoustus]